MKVRQESAERSQRATPAGGAPASQVLGRMLASVPDSVTLADLDLDANARRVTLGGAAASHASIALLIERLAGASFKKPRCVKATLDEAGRVKFSVVADYES